MSVSIYVLSQFILYIVSKMCPKVTASLLYAISAYKTFHRNALLSDNRENLYTIVGNSVLGVMGDTKINYGPWI